MKISIIEDVLQRMSGDILYVDSDTFFTGDPSRILVELTENISLMHTKEYSFSSLNRLPLPSGAPFHAVANFLREGKLSIAREFEETCIQLFSWNAGVIGLQSKHRELLADVYAITDQLYTATGNHASEQYAFSIVLQLNTKLKACDKVIYHYWYKVKKQIVDRFLSRRINESWSSLPMNKKSELIKTWIKILPTTLETDKLALRDNAIQAFNRDEFGEGFLWTLRALVSNPFHVRFIRDVVYHTRRFVLEATK